jgi:hypothetical protein
MSATKGPASNEIKLDQSPTEKIVDDKVSMLIMTGADGKDRR